MLKAESSVKEQESGVGDTGELNGAVTRGIRGALQGSPQQQGFRLHFELIALVVCRDWPRGAGRLGRPAGKPWP